MDLNYLKKILKIFEDSKAYELGIEEEGLKIKLSKFPKKGMNIPYLQNSAPPQPVQSFVEVQPLVTENNNPSLIIENANEEEIPIGHIIKSPIVGTFYSASSPDSEPFVQIGMHISKGATLCIVEAMKLMNEIESDISGVVTKILVENSQPVEYGQPMFVIKPD